MYIDFLQKHQMLLSIPQLFYYVKSMNIELYVTSYEFSKKEYIYHIYQKEKYLHYYENLIIKLIIELKQTH